MSSAVVYPDLELRGAGFDLLALLSFLLSVISPFLPKIRGEGGGGWRAPTLEPPLEVSRELITCS